MADTTGRKATPMQAWQVAIQVVRNELPKVGPNHREQAKALGIGSATLSEFLAGEMRTSPEVLRKINLGLGWPRGHLERIIKGDPAVIERYEMDDHDLKRFTLSVFEDVVA